MSELVKRLLGRPFLAPDGDGNGGGGNAGDAGAGADGAGQGESAKSGGEGDKGNSAGASGDAGEAGKTRSQSLTEALLDGLEGEAAEFAKRFTSKKDLVLAAIDLRKKNGSMVNIPKADSKPEVIETFRNAVGAPKDIGGYVFKETEGVEPTEADKALRTAVATVLHKHHAPAVLAGELQAIVEQAAEAVEAEQERVAVAFRQDTEAALKKEWGADFDANVEVAKRARAELGDESLRVLLNTPVSQLVEKGKDFLLGDHPALVRHFGTIGKREMPYLGALTAELQRSVQEEIDALYAKHPPGSQSFRDPGVQRQFTQLFEKLAGNEPIVGSEGRAA